MKTTLLVAALFMLWMPDGASPPLPQEIPGLEAWYDAEILHRRMRNGAKVLGWEDASGNGHGLVFDGESEPATFNTLQLNERPVVHIRRSNSYAVTRPFDLEDHTIFLVYATSSAERALFRSDTDEKHGVLLHHRDRAVARREVFDRVWPNVVVSEAALASALREVRRALADDPKKPRIIETLRGHGYRFIAPVEERSESAPANSMTIRSRPRAMPPCGGAPYCNASSRNPNRSSASACPIPNNSKQASCNSRSWMRIEPPPSSNPLSTTS